MTSLREPKPHTVKLKQEYWLQEDSKTKLLQLGAVCMDKVVEEHHYYDTSTYALARNEMWLSQKKQQWRLIVVHQKQERHTDMDPNTGNISQKATKQSFPSAGNGEKQGHGKQDAVNEDISGESRTQKYNRSDVRKGDKHQSNKLRGDQPSIHRSTKHHELLDEKEIVAYLVQFLHPALSEDGRNMMMKECLQLSGIQHYATYRTTVKETYQLLDKYLITVHTDDTSSKRAAVISMDSDVQNIARGFEEMENLAKELKLQHQST
ncbi:uncharacterized protein LOC115472954 [Microcaecilia unicolor]|uniref:Uncharacterized protein LOC115472954 n=1 Tax=Microcaecilia unicolor TaxID=1415580 RepID=A0A6P7YEJ1_9AMPH|nr:uncharacterized protein LOC115472954 [Microcaecilia unicolor]